jgi:hypothetical protein
MPFALSVTGILKARLWKDMRALHHGTGTPSIRTKQSILHRRSCRFFMGVSPEAIFLAPACPCQWLVHTGLICGRISLQQKALNKNVVTQG